jgi:hypothetical protein
VTGSPGGCRVGEISGLREDEPNAVVFRLLRAVTQHEHDLLSNIDGETRKHGPHFGLEQSQGFEDERIGGRSPLGLDLPGDSTASGHTARIARTESYTANSSCMPESGTVHPEGLPEHSYTAPNPGSVSSLACWRQLTVRAAENPCTLPAALFARASALSIPSVTK